MTQEEANLMYGENSWGMYRFNINKKDVLQELLNFNERHPMATMLNVCVNGARMIESDTMFNTDEVSIHLYYHERTIDVTEEIHSNMTLHNAWTDSDCYDLSDENIGQMAKKTATSRWLILQLMKLNDDFVSLFMPKEKED